MTDSKLRELERKWKESGSTDDEAELLNYRRLSGLVTDVQLELAAYLEYEAAMLVTKRPPGEGHLGYWVAGIAQGGEAKWRHWRPTEPLGPWTEEIWSKKRSVWEKVLFARAAIPSARLLLPVFAAEAPGDFRLQAAVEAVEEWIVDPEGTDLSQLPDQLHELDLSFRTEEPVETKLTHAIGGVILTVRVATFLGPDRDGASRAALHAERALVKGNRLHRYSERPVRRAIREDIVPWALGYSDPVKERVLARQQEATGE